MAQGLRRMRRQLVIAVLGLSLWSLVGAPRFWSVLACCGLAWLALNVERVVRTTPSEVFAGARGALVLCLVGGPAIVALATAGERFLYGEGLHGIEANVRDRMRLERLPAIHPAVVFGDHPQRMYVLAPDAERVEVDLGTRGAPVVDDLGGGLFRVTYDPRSHGALPRQARIEAGIVVDGRRTTRELATVSPAPHPRWLCRSADALRAYAPSEETDELVMIDDRGLGFRARVDDGPTRCAAIGDSVFVAHRHANVLLELDGRTGHVRRRGVMRGPVYALAASRDGERLFAGVGGRESGVDILRVADLATIQRVPLSSAPEWLVRGDDGGLVVASRRERTIWRIARDGERFRLAAENVPMERPVVAMAASLDGQLVYVAAADFRDAIGKAPHPLGNHFVQDQILALRASDLKVVGSYSTARRDARQDEPGSVTRGASPSGIDPQEDGSLLVAFAGTDEVWRFDPPSGLVSLRIETAPDRLPAPHGVARLASGAIVVSSPVGGAIAIYEDGRRKRRALLDDFARADYGSVDLRRHGERVFYEATRTGISCASCHVHADTDHSVHNIGPRLPLVTLTVRGLAGTAPYLRDASHPRLGDLLDVSDGMLRGYLRGDGKRRRAMAAYLVSLPREPSPDDPPIELLRAGHAAFQRAGCDLCHTAPAFTNLGQHPIVALFPDYGRSMPASDPLDTPSLLGVHGSPPYLQDGRAETLRDVLRTHNSSNRHGDTASLDEREIDALVAFLEAL
jgi:mono/diheme cytochrome c family protein